MEMLRNALVVGSLTLYAAMLCEASTLKDNLYIHMNDEKINLTRNGRWLIHNPGSTWHNTVAPTSSLYQHGNCVLYSSYRELDKLLDHNQCMSANTVWHLLDDLQSKDSSCRKNIQERLTRSYNNVSIYGNNGCLCTSKLALTDMDHIHRLHNGSHDECIQQTGSTYTDIERDLFTHITVRGCRNHNYLWATLAGVKDYCVGSNCHARHVDCTQDLIVRASQDFPSRESDSCVCTRAPSSTTWTTKTTSTIQQTTTTTTTHASVVVTQTAVSLKCTDINSYNYLKDFIHKDKCESVDLVFKYLHDMTEQKGDGTCRRDIINKLASHFGAQTHTPDHCLCTGTFQLQNYSRSSTDDIMTDLAYQCFVDYTAYGVVYHNFFASRSQPQNLVCRTHHSLWTQLRDIDNDLCQKNIVYHISYAFSQHGDPCSCSALLHQIECNHTCTLNAVLLPEPVENSQADNCSVSRTNEALPMKCCNIGDHLSWTKGAQVQRTGVCSDGDIPKYTPVSLFNDSEDVVTYNHAGIYVGCIKNGAPGFMMIFQDCNTEATLKHVDGSDGTNPNNYFAIS